jgi:chemotaxis family two-component system sensor kinase Cph1
MRPAEALASLEKGSHICLLYNDFAEQKATVLPFLRQGLAQGERCVCLPDDLREDECYLELEAYGPEVALARSNGSLLVGRSSSFELGGESNSIAMARGLLAFFESTLSIYPGVRFALEMPGSLGHELAADELCHREATLDVLHVAEPIRTICMYDLREVSAAVVHGALRTHPQAIVAQRLCPNPYYEAPAILEHEPHLNVSHADAETVERMIAELLEPQA